MSFYPHINQLIDPRPITTTASNIGSTSFTANWNAFSGATGYRLDVSTNGSFSSYVSGYENLDVGNAFSRSVTGLVANNDYYYRVRAYTGVGTTGSSNVTSLTTSVGGPPAPTATAGTNTTASSFFANWNSSGGATGYRLDVSTNPSFNGFVTGYNNLDVGNVLTINVTGLVANNEYYYRVRAYNVVGTSGNSNTINVGTLPPPPPPVATTGTGMTPSSFVTNWNSSSGALGYRLDVSTNPAFNSFVSGYENLDVGNVLTTNVIGLVANNDYYYRLRAYNSGGTSGNSNTVHVVTLPAPSPPVALAATGITGGSFIANWNSSNGALGYRLDVSTNSGFNGFVNGYNNLDLGNVLAANVAGLVANNDYYYRVRAYNSGGASGNSNTVHLVTLPAPPPPAALSATGVTSNSFTANWNGSTGALGYRIDVSTNPSFNSFVTGYNNLDVGNVLMIGVTGLVANNDYYYRVRAYDSSGSSANSNTINSTTLAQTRRGFDFDGDGRADISVFRPSVGEWYYQRSLNGVVSGFGFGSSTDRPVPADYTGDGKTDIAFFRPSESSWYVLRSEDSTFYAFPFGASGDIPAPADFDGDGEADPTVYRPAAQTWFILKSTGGVLSVPFGLPNDVPVPADYDGDGLADVGIYRPDVGQWWNLRSSNGSVFAASFGSSTDKPVPGDYTGDGGADVAFFRPAEGSWYVLRSEDQSFFAFPFGNSTDKPAPADFDGDGIYDAAVFRPSDTNWYIAKSTGGVLIQQFGLPNDVPLPGAFMP